MELSGLDRGLLELKSSRRLGGEAGLLQAPLGAALAEVVERPASRSSAPTCPLVTRTERRPPATASPSSSHATLEPG